MRRALLVIVLVAARAAADPSAQEQAKSHFKLARALEKSGQYSRAADEFKAAYELDHRPEMLFNIAQAYRFGGELKPALDYYQQYLAAQPDGAGAKEAREQVAELTKRIDAERPPPPTEPPSEPVPVEPVRGAPVRVPPVPEHPREPMNASMSTLRIAGLVTAGAGAIAIGFGVKFGLDARAAADDISNHTSDWTPAEMTRFADGQRANRNMVIAYVTGGALVVTGGVLYVLGGRAQVAPVVSASTAGVGMWGRF